MISDKYTAGFIDADGYLGIMKHHTRDSAIGYRYIPVIKIGLSFQSKIILDEFNYKYQGNFDKKRQYNGNMKDSITWSVVGQKRVKNLLQQIEPFLVLKKPQAKILKKFLKIGKLKGDKDSIRKRREKLYLDIRLLNKRGKYTAAETKCRNSLTKSREMR